MSSKRFVLSVKAVLLDEQGRCLLIRRSDRSKNHPLMWDLPGGKSDAGESFDDALLREVREETGLAATISRVLGASQCELPDRYVAYLIVAARAHSTAVVLSDEHDEFRWALPTELASYDVVPQFRAVLGALACEETVGRARDP